MLAGELRAPSPEGNTQPPKDPETAVLGTHLGGRDARVHTNPHPRAHGRDTGSRRTTESHWAVRSGPAWHHTTENREHPVVRHGRRDARAARREGCTRRASRDSGAQSSQGRGMTAPRVGASPQGDEVAWELDTRVDGTRF